MKTLLIILTLFTISCTQQEEVQYSYSTEPYQPLITNRDSTNALVSRFITPEISSGMQTWE